MQTVGDCHIGRKSTQWRDKDCLACHYVKVEMETVASECDRLAAELRDRCKNGGGPCLCREADGLDMATGIARKHS